MTNAARDRLLDEYAAAFDAYLCEPEEFALVRAYELGRQALSQQLGVLDIATVHSRVLAGALEKHQAEGDHRQLLDASERFFVEALSPFEMAHRGFREANAVLRRLNDMLEAQGRRIASALHDEAAQLLVPVHLGLVEVARQCAPEAAKQIQGMRGLLDTIEERLRNLSHELRPPILDDMGLVPALEFLSDSISKRWGLPVIVDAAIDNSLPATIETTLYRITREALTNVAKHARAKQAHVSLRRGAHGIVCAIRDDGIGCDEAMSRNEGRKGIGLRDIRERVAALGGVVRLGPDGDRGTNLTVEIPLEN